MMYTVRMMFESMSDLFPEKLMESQRTSSSTHRSSPRSRIMLVTRCCSEKGTKRSLFLIWTRMGCTSHSNSSSKLEICSWLKAVLGRDSRKESLSGLQPSWPLSR